MALVSLDRLEPGQRAVVRRLCLAESMARRLQELGLIPGTAVACCWKRPRGGPAAYRFRGTTIALRAYDSWGVLVERC